MAESQDISIIYNDTTSKHKSFKNIISQFERLNSSQVDKNEDNYSSFTDTFTKRAALYLEFCNFLKEGNKKSNFITCNPSIIYNMIKTYYLDKSESEQETALSPEYMINAIRLGEEKLRDIRAQIYKRYCNHLELIRTKTSFFEVHYTKVEKWVDIYWTRQLDEKKDIRFNPDYLQLALSKALYKLEEYGVDGIDQHNKKDFNFWKMHILHYSEAIEKGTAVWYTDKHKVDTNQNANIMKDRLRQLPREYLFDLEKKLNAVALEDQSNEGVHD